MSVDVQPPRAETPLVTLLLLAFNQQATVGAALEGALRQTYANL